jgi:hypothetical protein
METAKVIGWIDIQAPLQDVYDTILDVERRMQLNPLWGATTLENVDVNYPEVGSVLDVKLVGSPHTAYRSIITGLEPFKRFSYRLTVDRHTSIIWRFQKVKAGTRLTYEEEFAVEREEKESLSQSVHEVVQEWLKNIKRYVELGDDRGQRLLKWLLNRYYLQLGPDQRKTVQVILFMHAVGMMASVIAIIAWGIAIAFHGLP